VGLGVGSGVGSGVAAGVGSWVGSDVELATATVGEAAGTVVADASSAGVPQADAAAPASATAGADGDDRGADASPFEPPRPASRKATAAIAPMKTSIEAAPPTARRTARVAAGRSGTGS
jgi:hypothetical protein